MCRQANLPEELHSRILTPSGRGRRSATATVGSSPSTSSDFYSAMAGLSAMTGGGGGFMGYPNMAYPLGLGSLGLSNPMYTASLASLGLLPPGFGKLGTGATSEDEKSKNNDSGNEMGAGGSKDEPDMGLPGMPQLHPSFPFMFNPMLLNQLYAQSLASLNLPPGFASSFASLGLPPMPGNSAGTDSETDDRPADVSPPKSSSRQRPSISPSASQAEPEDLSIPSKKLDAGFSKSSSGFSKSDVGFSKSSPGFSKSDVGFSKSSSGFSKSDISFPKSSSGFSKSSASIGKLEAGFSKSQSSSRRDVASSMSKRDSTSGTFGSSKREPSSSHSSHHHHHRDKSGSGRNELKPLALNFGRESMMPSSSSDRRESKPYGSSKHNTAHKLDMTDYGFSKHDLKLDMPEYGSSKRDMAHKLDMPEYGSSKRDMAHKLDMPEYGSSKRDMAHKLDMPEYGSSKCDMSHKLDMPKYGSSKHLGHKLDMTEYGSRKLLEPSDICEDLTVGKKSHKLVNDLNRSSPVAKPPKADTPLLSQDSLSTLPMPLNKTPAPAQPTRPGVTSSSRSRAKTSLIDSISSKLMAQKQKVQDTKEPTQTASDETAVEMDKDSV